MREKAKRELQKNQILLTRASTWELNWIDKINSNSSLKTYDEFENNYVHKRWFTPVKENKQKCYCGMENTDEVNKRHTGNREKEGK